MINPDSRTALDAFLDHPLTPAEVAVREVIVNEVGEDMGPLMSHQARHVVAVIRPHLYREAVQRYAREHPDATQVVQALAEWADECESGAGNE